MGVTDVDDKIIQRAQEQQMSFQTLAREQERQFFQDMTKLYVKPPTVITRVSEHLPEIVQYIQDIEREGFAYEAADGSGVYFSTQKMGTSYGKLDPARQTQQGVETEAQMAAVASVEESRNVDETETQKKDPRDFALWKAAKDSDEPAWCSPWGMGRPGWHIECSAMTHHVLGDKLDVHTGGVDLRFPHHNNEIAQCEAHNNTCGHNEEWCKHFVHFGHLYIRGRKMSKSLKNFIGVKDFLEKGHTADAFRLFCLQFKYRANLVYSEDRIRDAEAIADRLRGFFRSAMVYGYDHAISSSHAARDDVRSKRCEKEDLQMLDVLFSTQAQVDEVLLNDLDTPRALSLILELISRGNMYLLTKRGDREAPDEVLMSLTDYVLDVLDLFGLEGLHAEFSATMRRRFASLNQKQSNQSDPMICWEGHDTLLRTLLKFRTSVRVEALRDPKQLVSARILELCDTLRNEELHQLGIQVEDLAPGQSVFKLLSPAERKVAEADVVRSKYSAVAKAADEGVLALKQKQQEFEELMQIAPSELFKKSPEYADRFFSLRADGFPTHEDNLPLTKSQQKKLAKKLAKHERSYAKYWEDRKNHGQ
uniref:tRNA synthetases class I catalytic domain-containing protein n=1 Tax=Hyaloperonospora arabidopsidis (strain Emoy2) TaxID=559515 RepID=M4BVU2_HYAAE